MRCIWLGFKVCMCLFLGVEGLQGMHVFYKWCMPAPLPRSTTPAPAVADNWHRALCATHRMRALDNSLGERSRLEPGSSV
jgi:hypothetical protein